MVQLVNSQGLCDQIAKKFVGSNQQLDQHGRYYNNLGKTLCLGNEIFKYQDFSKLKEEDTIVNKGLCHSNFKSFKFFNIKVTADA